MLAARVRPRPAMAQSIRVELVSLICGSEDFLPAAKSATGRGGGGTKIPSPGDEGRGGQDRPLRARHSVPPSRRTVRLLGPSIEKQLLLCLRRPRGADRALRAGMPATGTISGGVRAVNPESSGPSQYNRTGKGARPRVRPAGREVWVSFFVRSPSGGPRPCLTDLCSFLLVRLMLGSTGGTDSLAIMAIPDATPNGMAANAGVVV